MKENNLKYFLLPWIKNLPKKNINNLVLDSRKLKSKDIFIAIKGKKKDGHDFIFEAISKKVVAVLSETTEKKQHGKINYINNIPIISFFKLSQELSNLAERFYHKPSSKLKVIGITGTNGKTTVTQLINQWSELLGNKIATMGTLGNGFYKSLKPTKNTTSSAIDIQSFLHSVLDKVNFVTIEVSSHGLSQNRVKNIFFHTAIFTNLTQDHLDYHKNMKKYELAKRSLFTDHKVKKIILNANDTYAKNWLKTFSNKYTVAVTIKDHKQKKYSTKWINAIHIKVYNEKTDVKFESSWGSGILSTCLIGKFNIENLLLALACMLEMNHKLSDLIKTSIQLAPVYGRMQKFHLIKKPICIIDYAHTPDALEKSLNAIKLQYSQKKIWCIFGCGGERDKKKRPLMGKIAEKIANKVIITNDNPRNENQNQIIQEIISGCIKKEKIIIIPNRKKAISYVFFRANINDIIFIAGKGHENYQIIGNQYIYQSDQEIVSNLLENTT
ncbi:UDP-N-acetylmuramoyl-L-alanyl-D-glutamate--2,6-diaminopimelate ligase [Buchnera aphidicola (Aphis craccivora)]|uniref:UDP-N-acetylmuramoyl-L-alanyl-D-glutamate--2,6-diaminopimelate ligase n=1 Tax=Buchnera aphidicola (Aphis craccivora) TaxID=466616 RepID=A0A4D6XU95_9GAMM|nr:UDP-N-acetylmuramoyl-L-alanyl-D-glutamate--2,6-diaminopimelate ligase [Buchnera aphidicola]QCI16475.1 UDP-N-acetylmuramoyl-L-alanyl-D-glutamate--2,6-diaminopimelate ligase [Buchnera aphidicola (Aphis craccivora)]QLL40612.1 UDP-N-acetylmuramoyl-L-alanyl-D-glutamate--2,6-diaminopimelate ligase [Buchnera aphidicola (Aphis craccivore)]WAI17986.1 MAG: UDP-N-acetylmuramoyl-L-alanyl-D-glutamate--2,6-diaminopimelate ligase [Buchnera aphidicola (Aphis craccivora)]